MCGGYLTLGPQNNKTQTAAISIIFTTGLREHCNQLRLALPGKYSTLTRDYPMPNQQNFIVFIKLKLHVHGLNEMNTKPEVYSSALFSTLPLSELVILEMVKIWPFYGQNMVLTWSLKWFLPESQSMYQGMTHAKVNFSG